MTEPVLRVLISKSELDNLRSELKELQELHKHSGKSNLTKEGGSGSECADNECKSVEQPCSGCRTKEPVAKDNPLVEMKSQVPPHVEQESSKSESSVDTLPISIISEKIWKRFQFRAKNLLEALQKDGSLKWDKFGVTTINGSQIGSIFDLMAATFHSNYKPSESKLQNLKLYKDLLKSLDLEKYVSNKALLLKDDNYDSITKYWYYIGP